MRGGLVPAVLVGALGLVVGCNLFGQKRPDGFDGWFHLDRLDRATNIRFADGQVFEVRDFGCADRSATDLSWASGVWDTLVAVDWPGSPTFSRDTVRGGLQAMPPLFPAQDASEHWTPGALCMQCQPGDAGVSVACDSPDAGP